MVKTNSPLPRPTRALICYNSTICYKVYVYYGPDKKLGVAGPFLLPKAPQPFLTVELCTPLPWFYANGALDKLIRPIFATRSYTVFGSNAQAPIHGRCA